LLGSPRVAVVRDAQRPVCPATCESRPGGDDVRGLELDDDRQPRQAWRSLKRDSSGCPCTSFANLRFGAGSRAYFSKCSSSCLKRPLGPPCWLCRPVFTGCPSRPRPCSRDQTPPSAPSRPIAPTSGAG